MYIMNIYIQNQVPDASGFPEQLNRLIEPVYRMNFHPGNLLLGLIGGGDDGLGEAKLGGFLEALLTALHRADFAGEADFAEHHQLVGQRLASE